MIERRMLLRAGLGAAAGGLALAHARAEAEPYVLGTLFPMAGPNAEYGTIFTEGAQLALTHLTADKLLSRPLVLKAEDSQGTPQGGAVGMSKLVNVDHALYVLIGFTGVSKAAAPIGTRAKVVMVNGGGVGPDLAGLSPYYWNVIPLASAEVSRIAPFLVAKGWKRVALIYMDDPFGNGLRKSMQSDLPKAGGEIAGLFAITPAEQQFSALAAKVRDARPDVVYFASYGAQQAQIIKQLRDNGIDQQLVTYSGALIPSVRSLPQAEGLIFTVQTAPWSATDPVTKRFLADWQATHKDLPSVYHQNYYNAVRLFGLLAHGLEQQGKPVDGDSLRAELLRVRRFALVGGEGTFDDLGDLSVPIDIETLKGGQPVKLD